jgi:hypothetical protein
MLTTPAYYVVHSQPRRVSSHFPPASKHLPFRPPIYSLFLRAVTSHKINRVVALYTPVFGYRTFLDRARDKSDSEQNRRRPSTRQQFRQWTRHAHCPRRETLSSRRGTPRRVCMHALVALCALHCAEQSRRLTAPNSRDPRREAPIGPDRAHRQGRSGRHVQCDQALQPGHV